MLMLLRENFEKDTIFLNREFFKDLNWIHTFLSQFNGVVYCDIKPVQAELHLDDSLTGMGEFLTTSVMLCQFQTIFKTTLVHLEMINILVALKIWAYQWKDKKIRVKCDNMAVVEVLTSGKTKDGILGICARNIWLLSALFNISGKSNVIADLLSRFKFDQQSYELLATYVHNVSWVPIHIDLTCLNASAQLTTRMYAWLWDSLRPATQRTYSRMFADFLAFLVVTGLAPCRVNVDIILAFLEYLVDNSLFVANIFTIIWQASGPCL